MGLEYTNIYCSKGQSTTRPLGLQVIVHLTKVLSNSLSKKSSLQLRYFMFNIMPDENIEITKLEFSVFVLMFATMAHNY